MYKAVVFDLDNTLLDYTSSELMCMQRAILHHNAIDPHGVEWDPFWKLFLEYNMGYWEDRVAKSLHHITILELSLRDSFNHFGVTYIVEPLVQTYWDNFCNTCLFEAGAFDVLKSLHNNHSMGIISNGIGEAQRLRMKAGEIEHYFDSIIVSDEVGYWKPDPNIFQAALEELKVKPHEVLFVGDSLKDDYDGALGAGIDFCYYNRKRVQLADGIKPQYVVQELKELERVIEKLW